MPATCSDVHTPTCQGGSLGRQGRPGAATLSLRGIMQWRSVSAAAWRGDVDAHAPCAKQRHTAGSSGARLWPTLAPRIVVRAAPQHRGTSAGSLRRPRRRNDALASAPACARTAQSAPLSANASRSPHGSSSALHHSTHAGTSAGSLRPPTTRRQRRNDALTGRAGTCAYRAVRPASSVPRSRRRSSSALRHNTQADE